MLKKLVLLNLLTLSLIGCANMARQDVGTLTGGVLGGALGNTIGGGNGRVIATVGGTLLGAYIGGSIGQSMDELDHMKMNQALEITNTQQTSSWRNPDSGNYYSVTPTKTYSNHYGQPCREYTTTAIIGGKHQQIYGTACRTKDGAWRIAK